MKCNFCQIWHIRPEDNFCSWCGAATASFECVNGCESVAIPQSVIGESKKAVRRPDGLIQVNGSDGETSLPSWTFPLELRNTGMVPLTLFGIKKTFYFPFDVSIADEDLKPLLPGQTAVVNLNSAVTDSVDAKHFPFEPDFKRSVARSANEPFVFYVPGEPGYHFYTNQHALKQISKQNPAPLEITIENTGACPLILQFSDFSPTLIRFDTENEKHHIGVSKRRTFTFAVNLNAFQQNDAAGKTENTGVLHLKVLISNFNQLLKTEEISISTILLHPPQMKLYQWEKSRYVFKDLSMIEVGRVFSGQRKRIDTYYLANTGDEPFEIKQCFISHSSYMRVFIDGNTAALLPARLNQNQIPEKMYQLIMIADVPPSDVNEPLNGSIVFHPVCGEDLILPFTGAIETLPAYGGFVSVDFGTINSCIAYKDNNSNRAEVLTNEQNEFIFPSTIYFQNVDDYIFGKRAKEQLIPDPDNTVQAIKRNLHLEPVRTIRSRKYAPGDFIRIIIRELVSIFQTVRQRQPQHLFVTVPASFSSEHRRIIYEAAKSVVPKRVEIFDEPTSSAVAYIQEHPERFAQYQETPCFLVVFDFGGGTLDVSVLKVTQYEIQILSRRGDNRLGGLDFDFTVASYLSGWIQKQYQDFDKKIVTTNQTDFRQQYKETSFKRLRQKFYEEAEHVKITLSKSDTASYDFPNLLNSRGEDLRTADGKSFIKIKGDYARNQFESSIQSKMERSIQVVENALAAANVNKDDVEIVLLTGQISRIPCIRSRIASFFSSACEIPDDFDPKTCVSLGAAYLASIREHAGGVKVTGLEKTTCRYGYLESHGLTAASFVEVIPDHYPYSGDAITVRFDLPENGARNIRMYQNIGVNDTFAGNLDITPIGEIYLEGAPKTYLLLTWKIDEYGVLRIFKDGKELHIEQTGE